MKMRNYCGYCLILFLFCWQGVAAQKLYVSPDKFSALKANSYERYLQIGDSLTLVYDSSPFLVGNPNEPKVDGLTVIREFYAKAILLTTENKEAQDRITDISIRIKVDTFLQLEEQYAKIIQQADALYTTQQYDQSIKLYERALKLKPADANVKNRIQELKTLKK